MLRIAIPVALSLFCLTGCATSPQEVKVDHSAQRVDALERALARTELRLDELSKEIILLRGKADSIERRVSEVAMLAARDPEPIAAPIEVVEEEAPLREEKLAVKPGPVPADKGEGEELQVVSPDPIDVEMPELKQVVLTPHGEVEGEPSPGKGLFSLAYSEYKEGRYARAILDFEEFVMSYPNHADADDASFFIGESYFSQGEFRQASIEFQKLLERYPEMGRAPFASLKVALCFKELGDNENYMAQLRRVVERYPDTEASNSAERMLQSP
ncbi:MAG: tol-pal system protein YbgF [Deltaproteobacteria bacterium]|nr:MAG: tol-pal system protein YbgF [Deltaproteobacteria bacterium]